MEHMGLIADLPQFQMTVATTFSDISDHVMVYVQVRFDGVSPETTINSVRASLLRD
jgi:hypothetical protein